MSRYAVGIRSDVGRQREQNQDTPIRMPDGIPASTIAAKGVLYGVADGMGGTAGGQVASQLAVQTLTRVYYGDTSTEVTRSLRHAVEEANRVVHQRAGREAALAGMGTTLTAAVVQDNKLTIAHVGDSRAYLVRAGQIQQLTAAHTVVEDLVQHGVITPQEALTHEKRHVLTRALGPDPQVEVDIVSETLQPGDRLVMCSDGLSNKVKQAEIRQVVEQLSPQQAVDRLVALANQRGGEDNITVVVFQPLDGAIGTGGRPRWFLLAAALLLVVLALGVGGVLAANRIIQGTQAAQPPPTPSPSLARVAQAASSTADLPVIVPSDTVRPIASTTASRSLTPSPTATVRRVATLTMLNSTTLEVTDVFGVNLYRGPGTNYGLAKTVLKGKTIEVKGRLDDARWVFVESNEGDRGWVTTDILTSLPVANINGLTVMTPPPSPTPTLTYTITPTPTVTQTPTAIPTRRPPTATSRPPAATPPRFFPPSFIAPTATALAPIEEPTSTLTPVPPPPSQDEDNKPRRPKPPPVR